MKKSRVDFLCSVNKFRKIIMQFIKIFLGIFAASAVLGVFYALTLLGPSAENPDDYADLMESSLDSASMLKESEKLEREFESAATASAVPSKENLDKLRKAVHLQELYINRARTFDKSPADRLMRLQTKLQNIEAQPRFKQVIELESEAKSKSLEGKIAEARELFKKAYDIQSLINGDFPFSNYKNIGKSAELGRQVKMLEARPMFEEAEKLEKDAEVALAQKRWEDAKKLYEKALDVFVKMNNLYPNSGYSDFLKIQKIESQIDSLKSAELYAKILAVEEKAKKFEAQNSSTLAAEAYADAENLQRELNRVYPKSTHSSDAKVADFEARKIELSSRKLADEIVAQEKVLTLALLDGRSADAMRLTDSLLNKTAAFVENFPKNDKVNSELLMRLRYLNYMAAQVGNIQKEVMPNFIKFDSSDPILMYKTEIPQKLFIAVMQENPSRDSSSDLKPVDSVNYEDIQRFCTRLGWILARKISLPDLAQYKKALGSLRYANLNELAWNNLNSGGKTNAVALKKSNDKGFYDLLGNVSEYLKPEDENADEILLVGGNAQSSGDSILDLDIRKIDKKQRNRMGGFRVILLPLEKTSKDSK